VCHSINLPIIKQDWRKNRSIEVYHNIKAVDNNILAQIMAAICFNINQEQINDLTRAGEEGFAAFIG
jgi:hypothetical protein